MTDEQEERYIVAAGFGGLFIGLAIAFAFAIWASPTFPQ
jgi:hypothetical protein